MDSFEMPDNRPTKHLRAIAHHRALCLAWNEINDEALFTRDQAFAIQTALSHILRVIEETS